MQTRLIPLIASALIALTPVPSAAHLGHDAPGLALELQRVDRQGADLHITLRIENTGAEVLRLSSFTTNLGAVRILDGASDIAPGAVTHLTLALQVAGGMPGVFTLIADFGPSGSGPLLVFTGA